MPLDSPGNRTTARRGHRSASTTIVDAGVTKRNKLLASGRITYNSGARDTGGGHLRIGRASVSRRWLSAGVTIALLLAGCSGSDTDTSVEPPPASETSTSSTTASSSSTTERSPTTENPSDEGALATWTELMAAAGADGSDPVIQELATPEVADQLSNVFLGDRPRQVTSFASAEPDADGFEIQDCLILDSPISTSNAVWFSGHAIPDDSGGWIIDRVTAESLLGCVPVDLAGPALEGYLDHFAARNEFLGDPDPDSPRLSGTTTGRQLELYRGLAADWEEEGLSYRDNPEMHPEFVEVVSPTHLIILDCQLADPEAGVYVASTGERTELIRPIAEGERDALQTDMILVDGVWKAENVGAERDIPCEFAPTPVGLPVIPLDGETEGET